MESRESGYLPHELWTYILRFLQNSADESPEELLTKKLVCKSWAEYVDNAFTRISIIYKLRSSNQVERLFKQLTQLKAVTLRLYPWTDDLALLFTRDYRP